MDDADANNFVEQIVGCFNGRPGPAQWRDKALKVNSALLGRDRRTSAFVKDPLAALVAACRARFPGIQFHCERLDRSHDGFVSHWVGRWQRADRPDLVSVPCSCRVRVGGPLVRELWFVIDEYSVLDQLGRLAADPGQPAEGCAGINQAAFQALTAAFVSGAAVAGNFAPQVEMHVNVETYRDITEGVEIDVRRLEGVGKIDALVALVRERFGAPLELSFKAGISQGQTTTFRGTIAARVGAQRQKYAIVCGFVSSRGSVAQCWLKVTPPATLLECVA